MSNAHAIATVTATLRQIFEDTVETFDGAVATAVRPDSVELPPKGVNVFLYQVTPNAHWRNADLPTRRNNALLRRPQAALDLHYLLTFYGDDKKYEQQVMLGAIVRKLHASPALSRDAIREVINSEPLVASNLADQIDLVRLSPINFTLDEWSKLWSTFLKTDYVLSVAYMASVVLIETDDDPPGAPLPVLRAKLHTHPLSPIVIDAVEPQLLEHATGAQLTLVGRNLEMANQVLFTSPDRKDPFPGTIVGGAGDRITVSLPEGLRAGVNTVQLVAQADQVDVGVVTKDGFRAGRDLTPAAHVLPRSNAVPFLLLPKLINITQGFPIQVTVAPPVGENQRVSLILNRLDTDPPQTFSSLAQSRTGDQSTITFNGEFSPGVFLARIRVDDADSRLEVDDNGKFVGPTVDLL